MLGKPSTQHRANRSSDRGETRPCPDRTTALLLRKIGADQRQAAGNQQRPADSLDAPGNNELVDVRRQSAPGRGHRKDHHAGGEYFAAAVQVS